MRIRNILKGRCRHRPLQITTKIQRILRADRGVRPYKGYWIDRVGRVKIAAFSILRRRGRCPHRPTLQNENTPVGADGRYCIGFRFSPRRGGRPCPPAGIARIYGNPMQNRNILEGRCGHRPLQTTSQNAEFEGRTESSAPTKGIGQNVWGGRKIAVFPILYRRGRPDKWPRKTDE